MEPCPCHFLSLPGAYESFFPGISSGAGSIYFAKKIVVHEAYKPLTNDIAVLFLQTCIQLGATVQTIKMATQEGMIICRALWPASNESA